MKKLSILFGVFLMVGLMTGQAFPAAYQIDIGQNGIDTGGTVNLYGQSNVNVDIIVNGYACPPIDNLFGVQTYIDLDPAQVAVDSCTPAAAAGCDPTLSGCTNPATGVYNLICSNFSFIDTNGTQLLGTLVVDCVGTGTTVMEVCDDIGAPYNDGFLSDCNLAASNPTCGTVTISQLPPPCSITIAPDPVTISASSINTVTQQFTATEAGNCQNQPNLVWADDCTLASVNQSGLLTVPPTLIGESCTVCVVDTANTGATPDPVQDCAAVTIAPGAACDVEIYMGGDPGFCAENCQDPVPPDDPPYNRPGRRGLALTCGDIVDFCACDDCTENEPLLDWSVQCTKPGVATITSTSDCTSRLIVSDANCQFLAEVVNCVVTVNDSVNNSSDSIELQIGKITVDLSEETVAPDTDSVQVDVTVTNNDHTIRALDIIVDECQAGDDNLVCTGCVADPARALGFTCTASEQPDGSCRIVLFSAVDRIEEGVGRVATIVYDVVDAANCPDCVCLEATLVQAADQFNEALCACTDTGEVCFDVCGDIYPQDCLNPGCKPCGDGVVDLFDILEAVDIILGLQVATPCQIDNGDVPNGMPPYCGDPAGDINCESDGDLDIFDLLVIIDMALDKMNCCDYCTNGAIF